MTSGARFMFSGLAALALAGCGGSDGGANAPVAPATLGGTVSGLPAGITILLRNNETDLLSVAANGAFAFEKHIPAGSAYQVSLFTQPTGAVCQVANGSGTVNAAGDPVGTIAVRCQPGMIAMQNYHVTVSVTGLAPEHSATFLLNGADPLTVSGSGLFVFPKSYALQMAPSLGAYSVTVAAHPPGQLCSLSEASGVNLAAAFRTVVNVSARCQ